MAGRGPAPKPPAKRSRARDAQRAGEPAQTDLQATPSPVKVRPLPGASKRNPRTRRWWKVAARSPQAGQFLETDWLVMERLADLYDVFFTGEMKVASEIRLCEAKLGFTPEDRLRLRWQWRSEGDGETADDERGPQARSSSRRSGRDPRLTAIDGGRAS